ncbi:hypothetical protein RUND412_011381 [Rhizina undulata]
MPNNVNRACDCCNRRKIRCDRGKPCENCDRAELACTYAAKPRKRGPKGSAARTIYALRLDQAKETSPECNKCEICDQSSPTYDCAADSTLRIQRSFATAFEAGPSACSVGGDPANAFVPHHVLSPTSVKMCGDIFFNNMYPIMPVLHGDSFPEYLVTFQTNPETYSLLASLCAITIIQLCSIPGNTTHPRNHLLAPLSRTLISETLRARKYFDYIETPTVDTTLTSFFLFCCYGNLERHQHAWYYLREAISFMQALGIDNEKSYEDLDPVEGRRRRRVFWLLFISERAYAVQRHRPFTLRKTIALPTTNLDDGSVDPILLNFVTLAKLFQTFDDQFIALWNSGPNTPAISHDGSTDGLSDDWLSGLHRQLGSSFPEGLVTDIIPIQKADILVSQQWLHLIVWQLSVAKGCLSSGEGKEEALRFQFPIKLARSVVAITSRVSLEALEAHGIGMQEKLFDIACSLSDVIKFVPTSAPASSFTIGPRDYLQEFVSLLSSLRCGQSRYLQALVTKTQDILQVNSPRLSISYPESPTHSTPSSTSSRSRTNSPEEEGGTIRRAWSTSGDTLLDEFVFPTVMKLQQP